MTERDRCRDSVARNAGSGAALAPLLRVDVFVEMDKLKEFLAVQVPMVWEPVPAGLVVRLRVPLEPL